MPILPVPRREKKSALDTVAMAVNMAGTAASATKNIYDVAKPSAPLTASTEQQILDMADKIRQQQSQTQQDQIPDANQQNPFNPTNQLSALQRRYQTQRLG